MKIMLYSIFLFVLLHIISCSNEATNNAQFSLSMTIERLTSEKFVTSNLNIELTYHVRNRCYNIIEYREPNNFMRLIYTNTDSIFAYRQTRIESEYLSLDSSQKSNILYLLETLSSVNSNGYYSEDDHALIYLDYSDSTLSDLKKKNPDIKVVFPGLPSRKKKEYYENEAPYKYVLLNIFDKSNSKIIDYYKHERTLNKINDNWYYFRSFVFSSCPKFSPGED